MISLREDDIDGLQVPLHDLCLEAVWVLAGDLRLVFDESAET